METDKTSPHMAVVITQLAARYNVDLRAQGPWLSLAMSSRDERWLITSLSGGRISVTHCWIEDVDELAPDLEMVFAIETEGWEPRELLYTDEVWQAYVQAAETTSLPLYQANGELCFTSFTEYWADQLQMQGWLTQAYPVAAPANEQIDPFSGRMAGCQSTNHPYCYGELWQCSACGKVVCYAEGTDDHRELCDDCWVKQFGDKEDNDVPF